MLLGKSLNQQIISEQIEFVKRLLPVIKFAWFPVRLNNDNHTNGKWLWLEKYISAGVSRSVFVTRNTPDKSIIRIKIKINSGIEDTVASMSGYSGDSMYKHDVKTSTLLNKQVGWDQDDLLSINSKLVIDPLLHTKLEEFITRKEKELENDNNK